ncbi:hypothetical protein SteCoe_21312 [Stentor coeruleus]|uniref:RecA family profile 1 domain-containing protein n=1 Tax=Stentor coeruleus TaxID=5963 RepID=A0A1R2BQB4_9CILI|nr:hypothetical protein SteCoe_21312 [Stentor coeruleus]
MELPSWWSSNSDEVIFNDLNLDMSVVPTQIEALDDVIFGGLITGCIYEVVGEAGTGKTNFCLEVVKNISKTHKCYYLNTLKPVSQSRLASIGANLSNIIFRYSTTFEQSKLYIYEDLGSLLNINDDIKLIVVDNIYSFVAELDDPYQKSSAIRAIAMVLKLYSDKYKVAVIIVNNVVADMQGKTVPGLGVNWANCINYRLLLEKKINERTLKILQSIDSSQGTELILSITNTSVNLISKSFSFT